MFLKTNKKEKKNTESKSISMQISLKTNAEGIDIKLVYYEVIDSNFNEIIGQEKERVSMKNTF